ncbi:response regulator receiver modulated CheB methylesterase [Geobacter metallireducens RCH3]|uniref:Protein-glutamate methylesterase/protein-glutamine glutaminase 5 n=1 Tax=Geobacter metallireducens (strain ATCC 53774 / DSM 7210 / GS-15) TaxID=269799 RepID=CHEB5_GEOMG|nr:chemotaxis response regulator protein-glutamate methylesterase [Geobacter metallireducens]Q39QJ2.1 RecName: Full=Protein-glutamate methylesterase/protein-glutamine glutaminase 5 [Geobacter metallireducens GS-15]ABB33482.1 protein glutamate methylesterase CheB associated with MCPs of classes 40H and 40+24H, response receiver domain-containing [Geobacter metallireducens GS-15]EHP87533.1 response regulator receiver modulated CheB methylesterase [Geobacter metallireducens RCH3]
MLPNQERKLRVLVVDDSSFMRMVIRSVLEKDPAIEVIAVAMDGVEGVEKALALRPDLITMDIEMPRLDGISALKEIMAKAPTRVLMVSTLTCEGAKATFDALDAGAIDYIPKNVTDSIDAQKAFKEELLRKVKGSGISILGRPLVSPSPRLVVPPRPVIIPRPAGQRYQYVGIGASTGGPVAVQEVLGRIPGNFPHGIVVAIHMPKAFTGPYAERLNTKCSLQVKEAKAGDIVQPGVVLVTPGGMHTALVRQGSTVAIRTIATAEYPQYIYIPSVDHMLTTFADACNGSLLGVILTGMGADGFKGMKHLKTKGGGTIVQDEATSTIYGMPRACIEGGVADTVLPLTQIGTEITKIAG